MASGLVPAIEQGRLFFIFSFLQFRSLPSMAARVAISRLLPCLCRASIPQRAVK